MNRSSVFNFNSCQTWRKHFIFYACIYIIKLTVFIIKFVKVCSIVVHNCIILVVYIMVVNYQYMLIHVYVNIYIFYRLIWTQLMWAIWTDNSCLERSMLENPRRRWEWKRHSFCLSFGKGTRTHLVRNNRLCANRWASSSEMVFSCLFW